MDKLVKEKIPLRVLVVDDSALYRQMLVRAFADLDGVEVVDVAVDGVEALEKIERLTPDLITLDVQMPRLDGLGVLRELSRRSLNTTVLMVSSVTAEGAPATVDALLNGAIDCILKPAGVDVQAEVQSITKFLKEVVNVILQNRLASPAGHCVSDARSFRKHPASGTKMQDVIVIGASTGGPQALRTVLRSLPAAFDVPLFIVQHMPSAFTASLASRLNQIVD